MEKENAKTNLSAFARTDKQKQDESFKLKAQELLKKNKKADIGLNNIKRALSCIALENIGFKPEEVRQYSFTKKHYEKFNEISQ